MGEVYFFEPCEMDSQAAQKAERFHHGQEIPLLSIFLKFLAFHQATVDLRPLYHIVV